MAASQAATWAPVTGQYAAKQECQCSAAHRNLMQCCLRMKTVVRMQHRISVGELVHQWFTRWRAMRQVLGEAIQDKHT